MSFSGNWIGYLSEWISEELNRFRKLIREYLLFNLKILLLLFLIILLLFISFLSCECHSTGECSSANSRGKKEIIHFPFFALLLAFRHVFFYSPVNNCVVRALRHTNSILYFLVCLYRYKSYTPHLSTQTFKLGSKPLKAATNLHTHTHRSYISTSQFDCTHVCLVLVQCIYILVVAVARHFSLLFFFYDSISKSSSFYVSLELDYIAS